MSNRTNIKKRVIQTAETVLYKQQYVSPIDILIGIGWLQPIHIQDWRRGKTPYLEKVIQANLGKISFAMKCFRRWATEKNLKPSRTVYLVRTKDPRREAMFSKSGDFNIEKAYNTNYVSPILSPSHGERSEGEKPAIAAGNEPLLRVEIGGVKPLCVSQRRAVAATSNQSRYF